MVEFRLLGPVEVVAAGRSVDAGPPQRRTVLAALAVDAGRTVPVETLIDRVWGDQSPQRVRRALHAHVARLRRMLEQATATDDRPAGLLRRSGGYLLDVPPDRVDVHRFQRSLDQARDPTWAAADRVVVLREALEWWRGEPLAGLTGSWATRTRQAWRQLRLDAVLAWAVAEIGVDNPTAVISPLTDLASEHPLHEPLAAVLMRALYAVGLPTRALEVYAETRRRLVEELAVEPGTELQRIHQAILRQDLDVPAPPPPAPPPPAPPPPAPPPPTPAQLPRDLPGFAGRDDELARLDALLAAAQDPACTVVCVLTGTAGVGKTALAVRWAHRVRSGFPDGQLYVNLRGFDPDGSAMDAGEAIRGFLDALQVHPPRPPTAVDTYAALYRSLLADKRVLLLLDNARDADQIRPLLPGAPGCLVLVTSRHQLSGLAAADGAHLVTVDLPTRADARRILERRLGAGRTATAPEAVEELITHCARLPLALAIVAARAAVHPQFPLTTIAAELRDRHDRLDVLTGDDATTDVRAVFSWSYRTLTSPAARLFRLLGQHPGPDVSGSAAASVAGQPPRVTRQLLAELTRAHLIVEHRPGRYRFHDLLRAYAVELTSRLDTNEHRQAATHRVLDHYLHTANAADRLLEPTRDPITPSPPQPGVTPDELADDQAALAWFTAEHANLLSAVTHAAAAGWHSHTWQLARTLDNYLDRRGHWHDRVAAQSAAVAAADRLTDRRIWALTRISLAGAYTQLDRPDVARTQLHHVLAQAGPASDPALTAHAHRQLAYLSEMQEQYGDALDHARQAFDLFRTANHQRASADCLNQVGWYHAKLGDHQQALEYCGQALAMHQELRSYGGQANTWDSLGYAHHHLGHHHEAVTCYHKALELMRSRGDRLGEAATLSNLGETHLSAGDTERARDAWHRAVNLLDDLEHPEARKVRTKLDQLDRPGPH